MNRKQFFKDCACAVCSCAAVGMVGMEDASGAEDKPAEDWRLPFVKKRYAKLLEILSRKMDEKTLNETLHELGTYCSSLGDEWTVKFRGDFDGFCKAVKQGLSGDTVTFDREKGVITMDSGERSDCFCPLIGCLYNTPKVACNCSLGWQQHTWETLLQQKVNVELTESVLRGGKRCVFKIHLSDAKVPIA